MDNKNIEILDDFDLENSDDKLTNISDNHIQKEKVTPIEPVTLKDNDKQEENPVVELINNKTTIKLIAIMLGILFVAVFFMPKVFELISNI